MHDVDASVRSELAGYHHTLAAAMMHSSPWRQSTEGDFSVQVLQELVGDKALQRFRVEYEKLFRTLKKSHGVC